MTQRCKDTGLKADANSPVTDMSAIVGAGFDLPVCVRCVKFCFDSCGLAYIRGWLFTFQYHMSPLWGFRIFAHAACYKHAAPLGLKADALTFPALGL